MITITFIPYGFRETVSVRIVSNEKLSEGAVEGIWDTEGNTVWVSPRLYREFPRGDQKQQREFFAKYLYRVDGKWLREWGIHVLGKGYGQLGNGK